MQYLIALIGLGVAIDYSLLLVTRWREELKALEGFKIGICWQGSTAHLLDRMRSVPLADSLSRAAERAA